jgi:hypothetical protein
MAVRTICGFGDIAEIRGDSGVTFHPVEIGVA